MGLDHHFRSIISGERRGAGATVARALLSAAEPLYACAARQRNRRFDRDPARVRHLPRPVISIGNLTAGGTGKTPIVRWLAQRLRDEGKRVGILSRGYKAARGTLGDEQRMLDRLLNGSAAETTGAPPAPHVSIRANPDRFAAGTTALLERPDLDLFLLDDGFQHRRLARDMDIVLINATEPFGFGHVLPRGLLREPLEGLRRAGAIVVTHASAVPSVAEIVRQVRLHNAHVPIYRADHAPAGFRSTMPGSDTGCEYDLEALRAKRVFAFCGLSSPASFERAIRSLAGRYVGHRWFADHHDYTARDLQAVQSAARTSDAEVIVTTEKDAVKLADLPQRPDDIPLWRFDVAAQFFDDDEQRLLGQVRAVLDRISSNGGAG